jgi:hypothetical protein
MLRRRSTAVYAFGDLGKDAIEAVEKELRRCQMAIGRVVGTRGDPRRKPVEKRERASHSVHDRSEAA